MINRILHSWSVNMKFMKLVVYFRYFARPRLAKYRNYPTRFINFISNDHSCKILHIFEYFELEKMTKVGFEHWLIRLHSCLTVTAKADAY